MKLFGFSSDGSDGSSLTGRWDGYYVQHDTQHRLIADLEQHGTRLEGAMVDVDCCDQKSLEDILGQSGLSAEQEAECADGIRELLPEAGAGPIVFRSKLPDASTLSGSVKDNQVSFTKQYLGDSYQEYSIGECSIGKSDPGHAVEYHGVLADDKNTIQGRWTIRCLDNTGRDISGFFELHRHTRK